MFRSYAGQDRDHQCTVWLRGAVEGGIDAVAASYTRESLHMFQQVSYLTPPCLIRSLDVRFLLHFNEVSRACKSTLEEQWKHLP